MNKVSKLLSMVHEEMKVKVEVNQNFEKIMEKTQREEMLHMTKKYVDKQLNSGKEGTKNRKINEYKKAMNK